MKYCETFTSSFNVENISKTVMQVSDRTADFTINFVTDCSYV